MMLKTAASVAALTLALGVAGAVAQAAAPQQRTAPSATTSGTSARGVRASVRSRTLG